jgi:hypothetical protein
MDAGGKYPIHGAVYVDGFNYWASVSWTKDGEVVDSVKESIYNLVSNEKEAKWTKN